MQKKGTLWMADWRDERGRRKRRGFPSRKAALKFQTEQANKARAKKAQA